MTTYNLRALRLIDQYNPITDDFDFIDVRTLDSSLSLVGDTNLIPYTTDPFFGDDDDGLGIGIDSRFIGSLIVGGQLIDLNDNENVSTSLISFTWSLNGVEQSTTILSVNIEQTFGGIETSYVFILAGDLLPQFSSAAEFEAFGDSISNFGLPLLHDLGPGDTIDMNTVPWISRSESDYIRVPDDPFDTVVIPGGSGSDIIDFSDSYNSYVNLNYAELAGPLTVSIDGSADEGSIIKQGVGTDTLVSVENQLASGWFSGFGGLVVFGSNGDDTFTMSLGPQQWIGFGAGPGNDTYNLDVTNQGGVRISYSLFNGPVPISGIVADLNSGAVSNNGHGGTDQINVTPGFGYVEIEATQFADNIIGSAANERFIPLGGDDTIDGGGGIDMVRYDRSGVSAVDINLATGIGTGSYLGEAFTHTLSNIENIRGSRNGNDTLTGNAADNLIFAYGGDDILRGGAGNDTIFGGGGFDTVIINANSGAISVQNEVSGWRITSSDGSDLIGYDVEQFQFNDMTMSGSAIQILANAPTDDLIIFQNDPVGGDVHFANGGNDTLDFTNITDGYVDITYQNITSGPVQVSLDAVTNTGSVIKADLGTDTFVNLNNAFGSGWMGTTGGLFIVGTALNDTFDITVDNSFIGLLGGAGNDIYNLDLTNPGLVRLDFRAGAFGNFAPQGLNVDLTTGVVLNDGFGSTDQINITAAGMGWLEIGGTGNTDIMVGSDRNERFITLGGDDTVDGGGGFDTVRYDRPFMGAVNVNLATGIATGSYLDVGFTQSLINIQAIRGSRDGNDTITGNAEANILGGMGGDDVIYGEGGNDSLYGWEGNDTLYGGAGADYLEGNDGADLLFGGAGNDTLYGGIGDDTLYGGFREDLIYGGAGNDVLYGDEGLDILFGGGGDDTLYGGNDQDTLYGGAGADYMDGGEGSDVYFVDGLDTIEDTGTVGYDRAQINDAAGVALNTLASWSGVDRVNGFTGNDTLDASGATQAYFLFGNDGDDLLIGGNGNDTILGGNGDDVIYGGDGDNILQGGLGNDTFYSGAGDDLIYVGESGDFVADAGAGFDRVLINNPDGLYIEVGAWQGVERIVGWFGNDTIDATGATTGMVFALGAGDDVLIGGDGDDTVYAGTGDDLVLGGAGDDALIGGPGNDTLNGGTGNDFLLGGTGADVFVFDNNFGRDVIRDFEDGIDLIDFSNHSLVNTLSDLVIEQSGGNTILTVADSPPDQITLVNVAALSITSEDFIFA